MFNRFRFSPHPISEYSLQGMPHNETAIITRLKESLQVWNLFWLSIPSLDLIPGTGVHWYRVYSPVPGAVNAVIHDVLEDEVMFRKLGMHPDAFVGWFEREDHTMFDCYDKLGGRQWVDTVIERAEMASARLAGSIPLPVISMKGNVVAVDFAAARPNQSA